MWDYGTNTNKVMMSSIMMTYLKHGGMVLEISAIMNSTYESKLSWYYTNSECVKFCLYKFFCINCVCTRGSWFSHLETIYNLYVFFSLLHIFFISRNGKYQGSIKYSGVLFWDSLGLVELVVFVLEGHDFYIWKRFTTCTYFWFVHFIFFSWVGMANIRGP